MPSPAEYQAAAAAAMSKHTDPPMSPSSIDASAPEIKPQVKTEMKLDESKLDVTSGEPEVAKVDKAELPKSDTIRKSFEQMAREKAAIRAEKEALKPFKTLESKLGPQGMHQLVQALESGDTRGLLSALGVKAGDVQFEAAKGKLEESEEAPADPRYAALEKKIAALEGERQKERVEAGRSRTLDMVKELAKAPEFEMISDDPDAHRQALTMVEEYYVANGELPADTKEASFTLALEAVNEKMKEEAAKWEKRLTKVKKVDTIANTETPELSSQAVSEAGKSKSLTNTSASRPASQTSTPRSAEDYQQRAIQLLKQTPG